MIIMTAGGPPGRGFGISGHWPTSWFIMDVPMTPTAVMCRPVAPAEGGLEIGSR